MLSLTCLFYGSLWHQKTVLNHVTGLGPVDIYITADERCTMTLDDGQWGYGYYYR